MLLYISLMISAGKKKQKYFYAQIARHFVLFHQLAEKSAFSLSCG